MAGFFELSGYSKFTVRMSVDKALEYERAVDLLVDYAEARPASA